MKKHLDKDQEFEILKLVLDKILWLGFAIVAFGLYQMVFGSADIWYGISIILGGAVFIIIFMIMLVKEYNYMK